MSRSGNFLMGILMGVLVGAAAGMLTAPRPGKETRERIKQNLEERSACAKENMMHQFNDAKVKVSSRVHDLTQKVDEVATRLEKSGKETLDKLRNGANEVASVVSEYSAN